MITAIVSRLIILLFGTLYPAYASYKAVKTKCVKDYVKWMMYWIVFAFFTCLETFTDVFLSFWFPFYYEFKVVVVIYLLSPATRGSSILYRNFIHPVLARKEEDIDEYINMAKEQGYNTMLKLGSKGVTYATNVIMQTAIKNLPIGETLPVRKPVDEVEAAGDRVKVEMAEISDDSRPSTPPPPSDHPTDPPSSPAHNTRSRKTRSRNTAKAK